MMNQCSKAECRPSVQPPYRQPGRQYHATPCCILDSFGSHRNKTSRSGSNNLIGKGCYSREEVNGRMFSFSPPLVFIGYLPLAPASLASLMPRQQTREIVQGLDSEHENLSTFESVPSSFIVVIKI